MLVLLFGCARRNLVTSNSITKATINITVPKLPTNETEPNLISDAPLPPSPDDNSSSSENLTPKTSPPNPRKTVSSNSSSDLNIDPSDLNIGSEGDDSAVISSQDVAQSG